MPKVQTFLNKKEVEELMQVGEFLVETNKIREVNVYQILKYIIKDFIHHSKVSPLTTPQNSTTLTTTTSKHHNILEGSRRCI